MSWISIADLLEADKKKELRVAADPDAARVVRNKPKKPKPPKDASTGDAVKKRMDAQARRKATIAAKRKVDMAKAAEINKAERQARLAKIKASKAPPQEPSIKTVPSQIAHCMMAVHLKRGKSKRAAWNICRWAMTKYGYLKGPYRINDKLPKTTQPTAKGSRRNFQHGMEKGPLNRGIKGTGPAKFKKFVRLFKDLEPQIVPKKKE